MHPEFTIAMTMLSKQLLDTVKERLLKHPKPGPEFYAALDTAAKSLRFVADQLDDTVRRYREEKEKK